MSGPPADPAAPTVKTRTATRALVAPERIERARSRVAEVARDGYADYFDDAALEAYDPLQGFLAEKLLLDHLNGALKHHLTAPGPHDDPGVLARKAHFDRYWKDWKACRAQASTKAEMTAFHLLEKKPDAVLYLLRAISREELSRHVWAYQAWVWNEVLRRTVSEAAGPGALAWEGRAGRFVFAVPASEAERVRLESLKIPLLSAQARPSDGRVARHYAAVLAERRIDPRMFRRVKIKQAVFEPFDRAAWARPSGTLLETTRAGGVKVTARLGRESSPEMLLNRLLAEPLP